MENNIVDILLHNGGTVVFAILFIWWFFQDKTKYNKILEDNARILENNAKMLENVSKMLDTLAESNVNISKSLDNISNNLLTLDKKIDRNFDKLGGVK